MAKHRGGRDLFLCSQLLGTWCCLFLRCFFRKFYFFFCLPVLDKAQRAYVSIVFLVFSCVLQLTKILLCPDRWRSQDKISFRPYSFLSLICVIILFFLFYTSALTHPRPDCRLRAQIFRMSTSRPIPSDKIERCTLTEQVVRLFVWSCRTSSRRMSPTRSDMPPVGISNRSGTSY